MSWVSFEEIKQTVSLEMVINHYRIELRRVNAATLRGKCPLPMHGSDTSRASFTATLTKGVGGVWACQSHSCINARGGKRGGNALDFVATMEQCSIRDAAGKLQEWFGTPSRGQQPVPTRNAAEKSAELVSKKESVNGEGENKPLTFTLQGIDPAHPYLTDRGITKETAEAFGVGFFSGRGSMSGRVVIPIHNERGELVAYAGRSIDGSEPRYKLPRGFHKSIELFNLHWAIGESGVSSRVVVVEGFFDCMKVSQAGFPCVALMGSSLSEAQEGLLARHFKNACIMLDGDEAGNRAMDELLVRLGRRMWVWAAVLPGGTQPDQLSAGELSDVLWK